MAQENRTLDSTRLSQTELVSLLDRLDGEDLARPSKIRREGGRTTFRTRSSVLVLTPANGPETRFIVPTRNLSDRGVGMLHGGFVHPGTPCRVGLATTDGEEKFVGGKIAWCGYVSGRVHQLGVKFDAPIDPRKFVSASGLAGSGTSGGAAAKAEPVSGRVLLIDDDELQCELVDMHLKSTKLELSSAAKTGEAVELVKAGAFDLVICDLQIGDERGEDTVRALHEAGCTATIVILTGTSDNERITALKDLNVDAVVRKPFEVAEFLPLLEDLVRRRGGAAGEELIASPLEDVPAMGPAVGKYVRAVQKRLTELEEAIGAGDLARARSVCEAVRDTGVGFGFPMLSESAVAALKSLEATSSVGESVEDLRRLARLGPRLTTRAAA